MKPVAGVVTGGAVLLATACGVTTEDEPQPIGNTTSQSPAIPSVDSEPGPIPPSSVSSTPVSTFTTTPTPSAPRQPAGLGNAADHHRSG